MTDILQPTSDVDALAAWPEGVPRCMTLEEYLEWDCEGVRAEWVDGEVVIVSPVRLDHQFLMQFLYELIATFVRCHALGRVLLPPTRLRLASRPSGREPDLMFIAAAHADRLKETYVDGPADLVIEIVSPESEQRDRSEKFLEYESGGVAEYWLIDPLRQDAAFYVLGEDGRYHTVSSTADGIYRSTVLEGFRLRTAWLWRDPLPAPEAARAELPA